MFAESLKEILVYEGGYANDKDDPGGATNYGITQRVYDTYRASRSLSVKAVKGITKTEVANIYEDNYWFDGNCHLLPPGVNLVHFDFCVNAGIHQAAKTLQKVLGTKVDGLIGPVTIKKAASYADGTEELIRSYSAAREAFYMSLAAKRPTLNKFLRGWLLRVVHCRDKAVKLYRDTLPKVTSA